MRLNNVAIKFIFQHRFLVHNNFKLNLSHYRCSKLISHRRSIVIKYLKLNLSEPLWFPSSGNNTTCAHMNIVSLVVRAKILFSLHNFLLPLQIPNYNLQSIFAPYWWLLHPFFIFIFILFLPIEMQAFSWLLCDERLHHLSIC